jgi:hypothetical protein
MMILVFGGEALLILLPTTFSIYITRAFERGGYAPLWALTERTVPALTLVSLTVDQVFLGLAGCRIVVEPGWLLPIAAVGATAAFHLLSWMRAPGWLCPIGATAAGFAGLWASVAGIT